MRDSDIQTAVRALRIFSRQRPLPAVERVTGVRACPEITVASGCVDFGSDQGAKSEQPHLVSSDEQRRVGSKATGPMDSVISWQALKPDPFLVLISCLLSLRTKDEVTEPASERLFDRARTPQQLLSLPLEKIRKLIYPVGFYKTKAQRIHQICYHLLGRFQGRVPSTMEELLTLPGVGRKTANLVLTLGFQKPGICVDVHVHRISNRWGYVKTKTPDETEAVLRKKLPARYWMEYNLLLVGFGQDLCRPTSPWCSRCPIAKICSRVGVTTSR